MMLPTRLVLQKESSQEVRTVLSAAYRASEALQIVRADLAGLQQFSHWLRQGDGMAVGSVEFVRAAFDLAGISPPDDFSYPAELKGWLNREVRRTTLGTALSRPEPLFIKPVTTKLFTGFLRDPQLPSMVQEDSIPDLATALTLAPETPVWVSEPVQLQSEYRYYVKDRAILGFSRYDQLPEEEVPAPSLSEVEGAVAALPTASPLALDFGVTSQGQTMLIEANDFWGLGLYSGALSEQAYLDCLRQRWAELKSVSA